MEESEAMYVPDLGVGCGLISHVEDPELVKKSGRMFGFWGTDSTNQSEKIFIMEHFYKNAKGTGAIFIILTRANYWSFISQQLTCSARSISKIILDTF